MLDILGTVLAWRRDGHRVALATLVEIDGSAPRTAGAAIAVDDAGRVAGSLSGGCVESDVYEAATACLGGAASHVRTYRIGDEEASDFGLTCGGTMRVVIRALTAEDDAVLQRVAAAIAAERAIVLATRVAPPATGSIFIVEDDRCDAVSRDAHVFVQSYVPKPDMYVFGAVDFSRAVASVGRFLGYRVTVVDARPIFATAARFPDADEIVVAWPDEFLREARVGPSTALVVLTHDLKFDVPLIRVALESDAGYVGVMGSRRTHAKRIAALRDAGVSETRLARLHAPIGLDIGAQTPEETAISIAAEIIASRNGRRGGSLREGTAPLHGVARAPVCQTLQTA